MKALKCVTQQPSPVVVSVPSEGLVSIELRIQLSPFKMPAIKIYKSQKTKKDWDKKLTAMMKASSSMKLMKTPKKRKTSKKPKKLMSMIKL